jgi:Na+/H+ antiporter NhaD/arsenite permease-like protein
MAISKQNKCPWRRPAKGGHRRLAAEASKAFNYVSGFANRMFEDDDEKARRLASEGPSDFGSCPVGDADDDPVYIHFYLMQGDKILKIPSASGIDVNDDGSVKKALKETRQNELFLTVDLTDPRLAYDKGGKGVKVVIKTDNAVPHGILCEVKAFGWFGRQRVLWGGVLFFITFVGVLAEKFHRVYATFFGSFLALVMVGTLYDRPTFQTAASLIDWSTLALLYAMMANVHILATTGFFQWSAARVVIFAKGDVKKLFYCLTVGTGVLSMFLDNVTTVMLFGPVTISIAKEIGKNPVPFYLAETICATVGGTATLIGDPPNVVIGNKLGLGFVEMICVNGPLVIVLLFTASFILSFRFPGTVEGKVEIDEVALAEENPITDPEKFKVVGIVFLGIMASLFTHPIHHKEAAWFMIFGEFLLCILLMTHNYRAASSAVEYDTLLFFAMLFVLVECLAELGVIRTIADGIVYCITLAPYQYQALLAQELILIVSCYGSAFLESLPYTACMCGILKDMATRPELSHISVKGLSYALSVGACVGGIGSIMGSSANLVCISISERYSGDDTPKVEGKMFLQHGLPVLCVLTVISAIYQFFFFIVFADITLPLLGEQSYD